MSVKYIIVDDEPQARRLLQTYMSEISGFELAATCATAMEAYEALHVQQVNLMFLDIRMPVISGTEFLRSLKHPPLVVFVTAYDQFAMEGFDLDVVDYLLKPLSMSRLLQAVEKVRIRLSNNALTPVLQPAPTYLFVKADNKLVKIELDRLLLVEGMQNYVKLHLPDRIVVASYTMKAMEKMLPLQLFIRVHRSFIIAKSIIIAVNGNVLESSYHSVPIGQSFKEQLFKYIAGG